jgi:hypothetical protein
VFEHGLGYVPCKLCLTERVPYYLAAPLALIAAALPPRPARFVHRPHALKVLQEVGHVRRSGAGPAAAIAGARPEPPLSAFHLPAGTR